MRLSIRVRLTLWYAAVFAAFLAVMATGGYGFLTAVTLADVDDLLAKSAATTATAMEFERNSGAADTAAIRSVVEGLRLPDVAITVLDQSTRQASQAVPHPRQRVAVTPQARQEIDDSLEMAVRRAPHSPTLATAIVQEDPVRLLTLPYVLGDRPLIIGVARVMSARDDMLSEARLALAIGIPTLLLLAAAGSYWLAGKSLEPVAAMTVRAREIGARNLHERLPVGTAGDELSRLAGVLNDLLGRVQAAFDAQTRFVAEASHELRTPVAVISGESEHALSREERPAPELRESLKIIRDESVRLRSAIDDLFFLARADAGERKPRLDPVDVRELAESAVRSAQSRAKDRTIGLQLENGVPATLTGDREMIRRVVDNLTDNAIKYSTPGGPITLKVTATGELVTLDVVDAGPGVPANARERLFERFYRGEDARILSDGGGAGLGLAIARWVARAHGGDVTLEQGSNGGGCTFRLAIPLQPPRTSGALGPAIPV